jgi:hypothetical protein
MTIAAVDGRQVDAVFVVVNPDKLGGEGPAWLRNRDRIQHDDETDGREPTSSLAQAGCSRTKRELFRTRDEQFRSGSGAVNLSIHVCATFSPHLSMRHKNKNCLSAPSFFRLSVFPGRIAVSRRLKQAAIVIVVTFAAAQLVRPERTNPATGVGRTIQAHMGTASGLVPVLDRACGDCHSNATVWPWYTEVAPMSWLMAQAVKEGRKAVNFSEWAAYPPEAQRALLSVSCQDATSGKMPGLYTLVRPETKLSPQDIETICAAARQAEASAADAR